MLVGQRVRVWLWVLLLSPMESSSPVAEIISVSRFFYASGSDLQHEHTYSTAKRKIKEAFAQGFDAKEVISEKFPSAENLLTRLGIGHEEYYLFYS